MQEDFMQKWTNLWKKMTACIIEQHNFLARGSTSYYKWKKQNMHFFTGAEVTNILRRRLNIGLSPILSFFLLCWAIYTTGNQSIMWQFIKKQGLHWGSTMESFYRTAKYRIFVCWFWLWRFKFIVATIWAFKKMPHTNITALVYISQEVLCF
jgi:hypothetical protein